jgi:hypothetical protein
MDLNSMFPKGKTYATETLARRLLNQFDADVTEAYGPVADGWYHSVILPVTQSVGLAGAKTRYQVIIILRPIQGNELQPLPIIDRGFCVTN